MLFCVGVLFLLWFGRHACLFLFAYICFGVLCVFVWFVFVGGLCVVCVAVCVAVVFLQKKMQCPVVVLIGLFCLVCNIACFVCVAFVSAFVNVLFVGLLSGLTCVRFVVVSLLLLLLLCLLLLLLFVVLCDVLCLLSCVVFVFVCFVCFVGFVVVCCFVLACLT